MTFAGLFDGTPAALRRAAGVALLLGLAACDRGDVSAAGHDAAPAIVAAGVVDSILPLEEELRRFQAGLARPRGLSGGAASREALVRRFVEHLARRDTSGLAALLLTRAEFAHLVYPGSSYTRPPYRTPPDIVWMQLVAGSSKGLSRLLREDVQVRSYVGHRCADEAMDDGEARLWRQCRVRVAMAGGDTVEARLFGVIVEHDGQYKFASYDGDR